MVATSGKKKEPTEQKKRKEANVLGWMVARDSWQAGGGAFVGRLPLATLAPAADETIKDGRRKLLLLLALFFWPGKHWASRWLLLNLHAALWWRMYRPPRSGR